MIPKRLFRCVVGLVIFNTALFIAVLFYKLSAYSFEKTFLVKRGLYSSEPSLATTATKSNGCTPRKNVVFLKTHKTGGSTLSNILNRFGDRNNLVFVVPTQKYNRLGWPWFFHEKFMIHYNKTKPNILCSHARYNREVLERIMPNDTVYVTILRDPVEHFESTFSYMAFDEILGISNETDPLEAFFQNPKDVLVNYLLTQDLRINSDRLKLIRNGMFYDLGLESKDFDNTLNIHRAIRKLDKEFDLVLITEYFEESMVMLKNLLCWETQDMAHFHLNQRRESEKRNISFQLVNRIKQWNNADTALYKYFTEAFLQKLNEQSADFLRDVNDLKGSNAAMRDICLEPVSEKSEDYQDVDIKGFKIRQNLTEPLKTTCDKMTWNEIRFLGYFRYKQKRLLTSAKKPNPWSLVTKALLNFLGFH
ncbi:galactosylceramide sulfotransferase-like [Montipora foliosa]|uniref:galactosylceramide sulfotransferase-like n=1 Tax=Montipora foliosa TaxID=591990 RepID=UPI0035F19161